MRGEASPENLVCVSPQWFVTYGYGGFAAVLKLWLLYDVTLSIQVYMQAEIFVGE